MRHAPAFVAMSLLTSLAAVPAFAQTGGNRATTSTTTISQTSTSNWAKRPSSEQWLASHLKGLDVYNNQNQKLGNIDELLMDSGGHVQAAVLNIGGVLGVGARHVAVPWDQLHFVSTPVNGQNLADNGRNSANAPGNPAVNNPPSTGLGSPPTAANTATSTNTGSNNGNSRTPNVPDHATLNVTQDQLNNAPQFNYNS